MEEAAHAVKITPRTLYRWLDEPKFEKAYLKARRKAYRQCTARLQQASNAAASSVLKVMVDPNEPGSTRLRAADMVLSYATKAIEIEDLDARLSEVERAREAELAGRN